MSVRPSVAFMWTFLGCSFEAHLFQDKTTCSARHDKAPAAERCPGYKRVYHAIDITTQTAGYIIQDIIDSNEEEGIHSFSILSDDRSKTSSKRMPPHSAI